MGRLNPVRVLIGGYLALILAGALALLLPAARTGPLSPLDALFTSASAVCVTGLIVKDTGAFFTPLGKIILAFLIQVGGLSYMTFATLFLFLAGKRGSLTLRSTMAASYPDLALGEIYPFAWRIIRITLVFEGLGFLALLVPFWRRMDPWSALGHAAFTSISAFCNAGFSTFSTNLLAWRGDIMVNVTVLFLIVMGGIGFVALEEYYRRFIRRQKKRLSLHARLVAVATALLIGLGFAGFLAAEWGGVLAGLPWHEKILAPVFMAITPRTAGFNTVDYGALSGFSLLLTIVLMVVGGSPGGTAGGLKTTTVAVVLLRLGAVLRSKEEVSCLGYRVPEEALRKSFAALVLGFLVLTGALVLLSITERVGMAQRGLMPYLFEVASAFGTVGLSVGSASTANASFAADLSGPGKGIIIITMIVGRIGVLSMFISFIKRQRELVRHIQGKVVIG